MKHLLTIAILVIALLSGCDDWDGMDRSSSEFTAVQTRQAIGLPTATFTPEGD